MNENEIRDLLGAEIGEEPPIVGGPSAVFAGARAHVVRTRALTGALSAVAVLGVAGGAVVVAGGSGDDGQQPVSAAAGPAAPTVKASTPKSVASTPADKYHPPAPAPKPGPGQVLIDGRSAALILKNALPAGLIMGAYGSQDTYQPEQSGVMVNATGSIDDGTGRPVGVHAGMIQNGPIVGGYSHASCDSVRVPNVSECRVDRRPDGSIVLVYRQADSVPGANGPTAGSYQNVAQRILPDGTMIEAGAENYFDPPTDPHEKGWHVDLARTDPLLTPDQVEAIVLDPRWGLTVTDEFAAQAKQVIKPYVDQTQKSGH